METKLINTPEYHHQQYEQSIPKVDQEKESEGYSAKRVALVALPFLSLYKPLGNVISLAMSSLRGVCSGFNLSNVVAQGSFSEIGKSVLETALSVAALAGTIFASPVGLLISTGHDLGTNIYELVQSYSAHGMNQATLEAIAHLANNGIYLAMFFSAAIEIVVISLAVQALFTLYRSSDEFQKGNLLEGFGHLIMSAIRTHQFVSHVQVYQMNRQIKQKFEKMQNRSSEPHLIETAEIGAGHRIYNTNENKNSKTAEVRLDPSNMIVTTQKANSSEKLIPMTPS